jgi:hypothetical protein
MKWWIPIVETDRTTDPTLFLSLGSDRVSFFKEGESDFVVCSLKFERGSLILSFETQASLGSRKRSALAHLATTSHGERTCRPNFQFHHFLTDFDVNPFFTSKSGKSEKLKIGMTKLIWDVTFFFYGGVGWLNLCHCGNHQR